MKFMVHVVVVIVTCETLSSGAATVIATSRYR